MEAEFAALADGILGGYGKQAAEANVSRDQTILELLRHRKLPKEGWDELTIDILFQRLAAMDSNNFPAQVGAGEREGRVLCPLVQRRHYRLSHGVGRSGDVYEVQPKAAGSSLVNRLACSLVLDAIRLAGVRSCRSAIIVPVATGMALMLCMLSWKRMRPDA
uniref:O-phosphoseryl-tRNA(Sec) selenium transferase n=2 Tax=Plectus sambesii TaxID=2011161 RepID=A0A914XEL7_9BILA